MVKRGQLTESGWSANGPIQGASSFFTAASTRSSKVLLRPGVDVSTVAADALTVTVALTSVHVPRMEQIRAASECALDDSVDSSSAGASGPQAMSCAA